MKNLIITDCTNSKGDALKGVLDRNFGIHNFEQHLYIDDEQKESPKSFSELTNRVDEKMARLRTKFDPKKFKGEYNIYYATLKKGFLKTNEGPWLFVAYAVFGKDHPYMPGMSEAFPLKKELWQYMDLPDEERYQKFKEFDPMLELQPLVYYINGTRETDWYKQAFRNCIPFGK